MRQTFNEKLKSIEASAEFIPGVIIIQTIAELKIEYMSPRGLDILGADLNELKNLTNKEYHERYFNAEDYEDYAPKILNLLETKKENEIISFFQQVRRSTDDDWIWYLSTVKIFHTDENGNPTHLIVIACPIDPLHSVNAKVDRLLEENNFLRLNHNLFSSLTNREKEILKLMATGIQSADIAERLHISEKTINTHRKNIRNKLQVQSQYDITKFAQAFNLI